MFQLPRASTFCRFRSFQQKSVSLSLKNKNFPNLILFQFCNMSSQPKVPLVAPLELVTDLKSGIYDGIVVVAPSVSQVEQPELRQALEPFQELDKKADTSVFLAPVNLPAKRIIFSGIGKLDKDYDCVASYAEATSKGVQRAISAGCKAPMIVISSQDTERFRNFDIVSILGAFKSTYVPLEMREAVQEKAKKIEKLGFFGKNQDSILKAFAFEEGKTVCRDIGGSDPERMAAPRVEEYIKQTFAGTDIKIEVVKGQDVFEKEYPCLAAVNRGASVVPRHDGRVIWLTYEPQGPVNKTYLFVGKGVTYDTGGADIKTGGLMAGMSRDKCGAATVAGIFKTLSILKPKGVKVIGVMGMIRNSCGENCYVPDEIITSRAGVRLRVGNTDAEGRMVMADLLCQAKEKALNEVNPHLMTIATLTGHVGRTYGQNYSAVMDNGPAKLEGFARELQDLGEDLGDMFEISTIRKEDFDVNKDTCGAFVDILQIPEGKAAGPRGHQYAAGFLQMVSGLDKHMLSSSQPLKYSHLDIAGSSGKLPQPTTASSLVALVSQILK